MIQSNLRLRFQKTKQHSSTQLFLKGSDSKTSRSLISVHITSRLKLFSSPILPQATHRAWKEVLLKAKPLDFWEQTLLKQRLKIVSQTSNHASYRVDIRKKWYRKRCRKSTSTTDSRLYNKKQNQINRSCLLSQHTTHRCVTLKNILMLNWDLIQNQPLLNSIFKDPPIISYKRGKSLKDMLVRAKIWR